MTVAHIFGYAAAVLLIASFAMQTLVWLRYVAIAAAIYLGGYPYRLRDFFGWLFARPGRPKALGALLASYGLLLSVLAFTY